MENVIWWRDRLDIMDICLAALIWSLQELFYSSRYVCQKLINQSWVATSFFWPPEFTMKYIHDSPQVSQNVCMKKSWATFLRAEVFCFFLIEINCLFIFERSALLIFQWNMLNHCCNSGYLLLKDKFTQMWKFSHYLTHVSMGSQGHKTFLELHSVAAFSQTTEVAGELFWNVKTIKWPQTACLM